MTMCSFRSRSARNSGWLIGHRSLLWQPGSDMAVKRQVSRHRLLQICSWITAIRLVLQHVAGKCEQTIQGPYPVRGVKTTFGEELLARVQGRLISLLTRGALSARERGEAGGALAALGDSRKGVGVEAKAAGVTLPDIDWIPVSGGVFPMGNDSPEAEYDDEKPRFDCDLIGESNSKQ